jgi:Tfp pilus assembly protein FimV
MTVLALFIVTVGVLPAAGDPVPSQSATSIAVRVAPADTLWSIAAAHRLPGVSTAQMVRLIADANSLSGPVLCAGSVLRVPAEVTSGPTYAQVTDSQLAR